jgi:cyclophilin family peptidyl-prolyl cis-trans isomerase
MAKRLRCTSKASLFGSAWFYNSTRFHRYEPGFVIQGGDPLTKDAAARAGAGSGGPGYQVPREYNSLKHDAMVLAAARTNDPDSAGSQFYFTLQPAPFLDEGEGYTVYGKVTKGQDVVLKLRADDVLKKVTVAK